MKYLKIIFINCFLFVIIFCFFELMALFPEVSYDVKCHYKEMKNFDELLHNCIIPCIKMRYDDNYQTYKYFELEAFRPASVGKKKDSIVLLGCSFAFGDYLDYDDTLMAILTKKTDRTVYNLGLSGGCLREMLYILRTDEILDKIIPDKNSVKDVIYVFIGDHSQRLLYRQRGCVPYFKTDGKYLYDEPKSNSFINHSLFINFIKKIWAFKRPDSFRKNDFNLEKIYISEVRREISKKFPNARFEILVYHDHNIEDWQPVIDSGISVIELINCMDVYSPEYQLPDGHPNKNAWEEIVPIIVDEWKL